MRVLVDVSGLCYRAAYKLGDLRNAEGVKTNVTFGVLRMLENIAQATLAGEMVICWDAGSAVRKVLYPRYKQNRKRDEEFVEDFKRQQHVLRAVLECMPVVNIMVDGVEADDIIASVARFCRHEEVGIVTNDRDLFQLNSDSCRMLDHKGIEHAIEFSDPRWYLWYKVLVGDPSDNVPGVLGVGDKTARALLQEYGSLAAVMREARMREKRTKTKLLGRMHFSEAAPIVKRNLALMRLDGKEQILAPHQREYVLRQYKERRLSTAAAERPLREMLHRLGFASILSRLSGFMTPFWRMARMASYIVETQPVRKMKRVRPTRKVRRVADEIDLLHGEGARSRRNRSFGALLLLKQLHEEGWDFVGKMLSDGDLQRLRRLINRFEVDRHTVPWPKEQVWLDGIARRFRDELPGWAKGDGET